MKVLCNREQLREGLAIVNGVVPSKSTRPAIENVCLVATENSLELVGTDLEVAIRYRIDDVKVADTGTTLIPSRVALEFVRDLSGETVSIDATGDNPPAERANVRITNARGFDGLPVFTPDAEWMMWTAQRGAMVAGETRPSSQLWAARIDLNAVKARLKTNQEKLDEAKFGQGFDEFDPSMMEP